MSQRNSVLYPQSWATSKVYTLDALNEETKVIFCWDYRHIVFDVFADNSADLTLTVYWSIDDDQYDSTSSASVTNRYSAIQVTDKNTGNNISGSTGIVYAWSSDWLHQYVVQSDWMQWVNIKATAVTAWDVSIKIRLYDNF